MVEGYEPSYDRWRDKFPKLTIDKGNSNIDNLYFSANLIRRKSAAYGNISSIRKYSKGFI